VCRHEADGSHTCHEEIAMIARLRNAALAIGLLAAASPAAAQWDRVVDLPASNVFSLVTKGDTIVAGTDTSVFVSTNAGASWQHSPRPAAGVAAITAVLMRNGRLFAGTFGQGVFISDNLGATWQGFNQGLVGGFLNSQLQLSDLQLRGDNLYAATEGAGVYVRNLAGAGTWSPLGTALEANQDPNVSSLVVGGPRLLALAGGNGQVYINDPGDADWTQSSLRNVGLFPGVQAQLGAFTGSGWVVGTNVDVFISASGQAPWTRSRLELGPVRSSTFAVRDQLLFAAFDIVSDVNLVVIEHSEDDGATWHVLDVLLNEFAFKLAFSGTTLYAAQADGLWRRETSTVSVPGAEAPSALRFSLAGPQPVGDAVRFRFELPEAASASIEVFDVAGRRAAAPVRGSWPAGTHEVSWNAQALGPGVYEALLNAGGRHAVVRLVHVR
jgi:hypothetical protein